MRAVGLILCIVMLFLMGCAENTNESSPNSFPAPTGTSIPATLPSTSQEVAPAAEANASVTSASSLSNEEGWQVYGVVNLGSINSDDYPGQTELATLAFILGYKDFGNNDPSFLAEDATGDITTLPFTSASVFKEWHDVTATKLTVANINDNEFKVSGAPTTWKKTSSNELVAQIGITYTDDSNTERTFTAPAEITFHKESWLFTYFNGRKIQYDWKISDFQWLE